MRRGCARGPRRDNPAVPRRPIVTLGRRFRFDASHLLPHHQGKCRHLHGHGYELEVLCKGPIDAASGMLLDFADLKKRVREQVLDHLDHKHLNDVLPNPTAEELAVWIYEALRSDDLPLDEIRLYETPTCFVSYRGEQSEQG